MYLFTNELIFIEVEYYENKLRFKVLTEQSLIEETSKDPTFWNNATKYASMSKDEPFVEEVAYMMVTLHRTGA